MRPGNGPYCWQFSGPTRIRGRGNRREERTVAAQIGIATAHASVGVDPNGLGGEPGRGILKRAHGLKARQTAQGESMRAARRYSWWLVVLGAMAMGCGGSKAGGEGSSNGGTNGAGTGDGGSDSTGGGNASGGSNAGDDGGLPIAASVKKAVSDLQTACESIAARDVECGARGEGDTNCTALTAAWFSSDRGFGPEVPDLSKLDDDVLRNELGVGEAQCKAACAKAADCSDVIAEAKDGACDGAADYTGPLDACRDTCRDKFGGYACGDGKFIQKKAVCDGVMDCSNGHDEVCTTDSYDCGAGVTVTNVRASDLPKWDPTCDGKVQCAATGKDEAGCEHEAFMCLAGEFVAFDDVCDGDSDCTNGADEADCAEFDCGDGERIPARGVCDSDTNCKNHSDDSRLPRLVRLRRRQGCGGRQRRVRDQRHER